MMVSQTQGGGSRERRQGKHAGGRMSRGGFDVLGGVQLEEQKVKKKVPRVSVRAAT